MRLGQVLGTTTESVSPASGKLLPGSQVNRLTLVVKKNVVKGYLTRRIRRIAHSDDINELIDRFQIVVPIMIHPKLEDFIKETFTQALVDAGIMGAEGHEILIPIHKPGMGDGSLPDLAESTEKNVRYWLIDSTTMWAGLDRRIDE